jgi:hypothetical protein
MSDEKTLDEALDEMDEWGEQLAEEIKSLSPQEVIEYFKKSQSRFEEKTAEPLNLPVRKAPRPANA